MLGALGVVYGDIGTSPLYALKECFDPHYGVTLTEANVLGLLSLFVWSIFLVISVKYLGFVMRADNQGEGGIMALIALLPKEVVTKEGCLKQSFAVMAGLFGAALLYGDGVITPAITVLSAIEGLKVATPVFSPYVVPITIFILFFLFKAQKKGTSQIGSLFGPMILIWFSSLAAVSIPWLLKNPHVLNALNPLYGIRFFQDHGLRGFGVLGAVVLCITGGEALYADMGHFGKTPIRYAWYYVVFPALVLNYFGQGAMLLSVGESALSNPFYAMVPSMLLYPFVFIATCASVIASQALITGAFSLTSQATQLGFLPRFEIIHTSAEELGQIYIPKLNQALMVCCIALVILFKESSELASAYGIAVTGTMTITSLLFFYVTRQQWKWSLPTALTLLIAFLVVDLTFFFSNLLKFFDGGWFPISMGVVIFTIMITWRQGRMLLSQAMMKRSMPLKDFVEKIKKEMPHRVRGTAVIMTANVDIAPPVLLHHYQHNQVLHDRIVLMTIKTMRVPIVSQENRVTVEESGEEVYKVIARFGFMERPDIKPIFKACKHLGFKISREHRSFYLGRESLLSSGDSPLWVWRKKLFSLLTKNAQTATASFGIPPHDVIELGMQLEL